MADRFTQPFSELQQYNSPKWPYARTQDSTGFYLMYRKTSQNLLVLPWYLFVRDTIEAESRLMISDNSQQRVSTCNKPSDIRMRKFCAMFSCLIIIICIYSYAGRSVVLLFHRKRLDPICHSQCNPFPPSCFETSHPHACAFLP